MELQKKKPSRSGRLSAEAEEALLLQLVKLAAQGCTKAEVQAALAISVASFQRLYIRALEERRIDALEAGKTLSAKKVPIEIRRDWNLRIDNVISYEIIDNRVILKIVR